MRFKDDLKTKTDSELTAIEVAVQQNIADIEVELAADDREARVQEDYDAEIERLRAIRNEVLSRRFKQAETRKPF